MALYRGTTKVEVEVEFEVEETGKKGLAAAKTVLRTLRVKLDDNIYNGTKVRLTGERVVSFSGFPSLVQPNA